jgi:hypothetical protein
VSGQSSKLNLKRKQLTQHESRCQHESLRHTFVKKSEESVKFGNINIDKKNNTFLIIDMHDTVTEEREKWIIKNQETSKRN